MSVLASGFFDHSVSEVHPCCTVFQAIILFYGQMIFYCMDIPHFTYLLIINRCLGWFHFGKMLLWTFMYKSFLSLSPFSFLPFFCPGCRAYRILLRWPGIEPLPSAVKALSLEHWATRKFPFVFGNSHFHISLCGHVFSVLLDIASVFVAVKCSYFGRALPDFASL